MLARRDLLRIAGAGGAGLALRALLPGWARSAVANERLSAGALTGTDFALTIARTPVRIDGRPSAAITVNGMVPGPLLRWREGDSVTLRVTNRLAEDTSIHWHGILVPPAMDGVPGVSFPGIRPGETFTYRFPVRQAGTYWYHTHSGLQEQLGHYGPLVIDPAGAEPAPFEREYVVVLSDWTFENPERVFAKLKKMSGAYNFQQRTVGDFFKDIRARGLAATLADRLTWGRMRMDPTDIADVTGATYTYLVNGHGPEDNWTALFAPGERVRLRFINAAAMSIFNVRIPGLPMTVVQCDGQNVAPVETDEFQIGVAETYDVIVRPESDTAFALICESIDRSGYARATLAPRSGMPRSEMEVTLPPLRVRPLLTMKDMGMAGAMAAGAMAAMEGPAAPAAAHAGVRGPGVDNRAMAPASRLHEPGVGLTGQPTRTLAYTDLKSLAPNPDTRAPGRALEIHLTGNMERYMWSFDGKRFSEGVDPIVFHEGERLRLTMINDTMMPHPIHLHGMFFELVNGGGPHKPRKHTVVVKPGEKLAVDVTADALGDWAFHCHLLYHMHAGMFRVVSVRKPAVEASS